MNVRLDLFNTFVGVTFAGLILGEACRANEVGPPAIKLTLPNPMPYRGFGWSVSLDGPDALVSANNSSFAGHVAVYRNTGQGNWIGTDTLIPFDSHVGDEFGWTTALDDSTAVIGAPRYGGDGAAYVFENIHDAEWREVAKLTPTGAVNPNDFGYSVSLSGSLAVVGAYSENRFQGAAYIFERDQHGAWSQTARLQPRGADGAPEFGTSVSIVGDTAIIGAATDNNLSGAAYIFRKDGGDWIQIARMTPSGVTGQTDFGSSVSLDGGIALIGASGTGNRAGAAFLFREDEFGNWNQIAQLSPRDAHAGQNFGWSVSISGSMALVGDFDAGRNGAAYVFQEDQFGVWKQIAELNGERPWSNDGFGHSAALDGGNALVGSVFDDSNAGSAYLFQIPEPSSILIAAAGILGARSKTPRKRF